MTHSKKWSIRIFFLSLSIILGLAAMGTPVFAGIKCEAVPGAVTIGAQAQLVPPFAGTPFWRPESAQWDPRSGSWYVSNQHLLTGIAPPTAPSMTDGYITQLNADGSLAEQNWVVGLGDPKGIRILEGKLYVADFNDSIDVANTAYCLGGGIADDGVGDNMIVVIDIATAAIENALCVPEPAEVSTIDNQVNDPVVDKKAASVYVSTRNTLPILQGLETHVWRVPLDGSEPVPLQVDGDDTPFGIRPNGTLLIQNDLVVVNGEGKFYRVDLDTAFDPTQSIVLLGAWPGLKSLDGLERDGGSFLVTMNEAPTANGGTGITKLARIRFQPDGTVKEQDLCDGNSGAQLADIGINHDTRVVAIPQLNQIFGNKITFISLDNVPELD